MADVIKVIFWGRGGEGAKTAGHILAEAAFSEGKEVQAFPEYGPERSGATIELGLISWTPKNPVLLL